MCPIAYFCVLYRLESFKDEIFDGTGIKNHKSSESGEMPEDVPGHGKSFGPKGM
jgi:hypothetical protein